jgi:hypothetical protein
MMLLNCTYNKKYQARVKAHPDRFGYLIAPGVRGVRSPIADGAPWAIDLVGMNGAKEHADPEPILSRLREYQPHTDNCLFTIAPDVLSDHAATLRQWEIWRPQIAEMGYPVAFAAQDGATVDAVPWGDLDALFVGGGDDFKDRLSVPIIKEAKRQAKWVHVGRVNWRRRIWFCLSLGVDSVDGSGFARHPNIRLRQYDGWVEEWKGNGRMQL